MLKFSSQVDILGFASASRMKKCRCRCRSRTTGLALEGIGNLGVQRAWREIMNVLANPKGKCWVLEFEFLEA
jgi:hypothetical protein